MFWNDFRLNILRKYIYHLLFFQFIYKINIVIIK